MPKTMNATVFLAVVTALLATFQQHATAQYRTTRSELRELKSRFEGLIELHEALAPTLEQMDEQLRQLQTRVQQLDTVGAKQEAKRDIMMLRDRLAQLEQDLEKRSSLSTKSVQRLSALQSEFEILESRVAGLQQRLQTLERTTQSQAAFVGRSTVMARGDRQESVSSRRVVGRCPNCGAKLVVDADGLIWHSREIPEKPQRYQLTSSYDANTAELSDDYSAYTKEPIAIPTGTRYESAFRSRLNAGMSWRASYTGSARVYEFVDPSGTDRGIAVFVGPGR